MSGKSTARGAQPLRGIVRAFRSTRVHGRSDHPHRRRRRPKDDRLGLSTHKIWTEIRQKSDTSRAPAVVYREQSLVAKLLRDLLTEEYSAIRIDNEHEYRRVLELVERMMPSLAGKVRLYDKPFPIFEEYGVQAEIDKALRSKVWLKSGGSIVINQTERSCSDVNTGRYVQETRAGGRHHHQDQPRAAKEIVRQIRLRDWRIIVLTSSTGGKEPQRCCGRGADFGGSAPSKPCGLRFGRVITP